MQLRVTHHKNIILSMTYKEQLLTIEWYQKRDTIKERDKNTCQMCMSKKDLHVHHKKYIVGKLAWEYEDECLITVCNKCHSKHHNKPIIKEKIVKVAKSKKKPVKEEKFKYSINDIRHSMIPNNTTEIKPKAKAGYNGNTFSSKFTKKKKVKVKPNFQMWNR